MSKDRIIETLGERELLLPDLMSRALSANDRVKYLLTLLQGARAAADGDADASDLREERLASGVSELESRSRRARERASERRLLRDPRGRRAGSARASARWRRCSCRCGSPTPEATGPLDERLRELGQLVQPDGDADHGDGYLPPDGGAAAGGADGDRTAFTSS